jgi:4-amino-4-deoxy-L-arabinose transferase-like glycosyltransferase
MKTLINVVRNNRIILFLLLTYFLLHITNLVLLPTFNDESIYLDWAWFNTHSPGHLYDSLLDSKQPLLIWIFGVFQNFFADPLFAGRLVSVIVGSITAVGVYFLSKKLVNERTAFMAMFLYSVTPIFVFYNRQALMEASIACIGIWSSISIINLLQKPSAKNGLALGILLGIGFLIKSSSLVFIFSSLIVLTIYFFKEKKIKIIESYFISLLTIVSLNILILINPIFWQTISLNNRYSYSLPELFTFPFLSWVNHLAGFIEIGIVFITPLLFISGIVGIYLITKEKNKNQQIFLLYFGLSLFVEIFMGKWQSQRYIVPFLPFLVIPASYFLSSLWEESLFKKGIVATTFLIPLALSLLIIFNPFLYISKLSKISGYSDTSYIYGQTSGYGIRETVNYIKGNSSNSMPALIVFPFNIGNPESAMNMYSQKDIKLLTLHMDSKLFPGIEKYKCLSSKYEIFFVTRNDQQVGMEEYFTKEKSYETPDKKYFIGIYKLKKNCKGNTLSLTDTYQGSIDRLLQIKSN